MGSIGELKILLAEDNEIFQRIASWTFKKLGLSCDIASNGKEAYEMCQQKEYDLIMMDLQMPVMNGLESTKMIRVFEAQPGKNHRSIIVALTANEVSDMKDSCLEAGMDDFMEKPFQVEKLRVLINDLFCILI
ncbi:MAG: response regulator [Prolixibacteraceae bacterium]